MTATTPTPKRFRERPRPPDVVEAMQITDMDALRDVWWWIVEHDGHATLSHPETGGRLTIHPTGYSVAVVDMRAIPGDWALRHDDGRFAVMSPDEFARRYEPLPASATEPPVGETRAANQP